MVSIKNLESNLEKKKYLFGGGVLPEIWVELESASNSKRRQRSHEEGIFGILRELHSRESGDSGASIIITLSYAICLFG